jgi:hypothetical protein
VRSLAAVEVGELPQDGPEVPLVHHDRVVQALSAQGADQSLGDRVRPRRPDRRDQRLDT